MGSRNQQSQETGYHRRMLLDNKTHGKVGDELRRAIEPESKVAILSGLFTVFGFAALKSELAKIERLKLLLADDDAILPSQLAGNADEIGLKNELNLQHIASECAQWVRRKAEVRALSGAPIRQNLFHVRQPSGSAIAISGTSDLTASGLGMVPSAAFAMNTVAGDGDNPNVFQICTLRDIGTERERRQTIGRGLRLAVISDGTDKGTASISI